MQARTGLISWMLVLAACASSPNDGTSLSVGVDKPPSPDFPDHRELLFHRPVSERTRVDIVCTTGAPTLVVELDVSRPPYRRGTVELRRLYGERFGLSPAEVMQANQELATLIAIDAVRTRCNHPDSRFIEITGPAAAVPPESSTQRSVLLVLRAGRLVAVESRPAAVSAAPAP